MAPWVTRAQAEIIKGPGEVFNEISSGFFVTGEINDMDGERENFRIREGWEALYEEVTLDNFLFGGLMILTDEEWGLFEWGSAALAGAAELVILESQC